MLVGLCSSLLSTSAHCLVLIILSAQCNIVSFTLGSIVQSISDSRYTC